MRQYLKKLLHMKTLQQQNEAANRSVERQGQSGETATETLTEDLNDNLNKCKLLLGKDSCDVISRELVSGGRYKFRCVVLYLNSMADTETINQHIIKPLLYERPAVREREADTAHRFAWIKTEMLSVGFMQEISTLDEVAEQFLQGNTILLIEGSVKALALKSDGWEKRAIQEPTSEIVIRGSREGFVESLAINISLLRRIIRHPSFRIETTRIGDYTKTLVGVAYIDGIVNPELIEEIRRRLGQIKIDGILESGYIEQLIEDDPLSPFPTLNNSERPDVVAAKLLEGRAAIIIDGTPFVLTAPQLFIEGFQSPDDYYLRPYYASIVRLIRFLSFIITINIPAIYVALMSFHQEIIPTSLLISIAEANEGTPFNSFVDALSIGIIFEMIREAGLRLPRAIGQTISIVGALVVGQTAVSAGLIGAPVVIMMAITSICSFVVVGMNDASAMLRILTLLLASVFGGYGVVCAYLLMLIHLASLRSFGTPYLAPFVPWSGQGLKDSFIRSPLRAMWQRPETIARQNLRRMSPDQGGKNDQT
ncbi:MAG: spore germination protein [Peptococcaceae bacterium]|jgi:spore germination protein KA|nr:spore germination protein [Peptococcaceae bacterium]